MRLLKQFTRTEVTLGVAAAPSVRLDLTRDTALSCQLKDSDGSPTQRLVVAFSGPTACPNIPVQIYIWDDLTETWYACGSSHSLVSGQLAWFDIPCLGRLGTTRQQPGSLDCLILESTPGGLVSGTYSFSIGVDVSSSGATNNPVTIDTTGLATSALQTSGNASLTSIDGKLPVATLMSTSDATPTVSRIGAFVKGLGASAWESVRTGLTTVSSTLTGFLNTLPWGIYHLTPTTRTDGQGGPLETTEDGRLKVQLAPGQSTKANSSSVTLSSDDDAKVAMQGLARLPVADALAVTRPTNTTPYSIGDVVANDATAGSVTPITWTISDTNDAPVAVRRIRVATTDTAPGATGASFRIWLFRSDPTASSGMGYGDNGGPGNTTGAICKQGTFLGHFTGLFQAFSDGSVATLIPGDGAGEFIVRPTSSGRTLYGIMQTLTAFTPSANSTTFTATMEAFQGRA